MWELQQNVLVLCNNCSNYDYFMCQYDSDVIDIIQNTRGKFGDVVSMWLYIHMQIIYN